MGRKKIRKNKPLRPKLRFPAWTGGHRNDKRSLYCERCRIKDGLGTTSYIKYGKCSYCGWTGRCYLNSPEYPWLRQIGGYFGWHRNGKLSIWSRNRKDK